MKTRPHGLNAVVAAEQRRRDAELEAVVETMEAMRPGDGVQLAKWLAKQPWRPMTPREYTGAELYATLAMDYDIDEDDDDADLFGPGGWRLDCEPELRLGDNLLVPDVAGWRRERMPAWPDTVGFTVTPDWICEIVGDATPQLDHHDKRAIYAREGVADLWIIDLANRTIEAWKHDGKNYALIATAQSNSRVALQPFDAIGLNPETIIGQHPPHAT